MSRRREGGKETTAPCTTSASATAGGGASSFYDAPTMSRRQGESDPLLLKTVGSSSNAGGSQQHLAHSHHEKGCCKKKNGRHLHSDTKESVAVDVADVSTMKRSAETASVPHAHATSTSSVVASSSAVGKTNLPSADRIASMPSLTPLECLKGAFSFLRKHPLDFFCVLSSLVLLMYAGGCTLWALWNYFARDCYFGIFIRILLGRNVVVLLDTLYVHVLCYGVVPHYRMRLPMTMERVASVRQRNVLTFRQKIAQTLVVFVPLLYFYLDSAEGCDYLCCANDASGGEEEVLGDAVDPASDLVPRYLADRTILCTLAALPCLFYIMMSPASALQDAKERKWLQARMQQGGHQHGKG